MWSCRICERKEPVANAIAQLMFPSWLRRPQQYRAARYAERKRAGVQSIARSKRQSVVDCSSFDRHAFLFYRPADYRVTRRVQQDRGQNRR
jgi:hypothetical protein